MRMVTGTTSNQVTVNPLVLSTSIQNKIVGTSMLQAKSMGTTNAVIRPPTQIVRAVTGPRSAIPPRVAPRVVVPKRQVFPKQQNLFPKVISKRVLQPQTVILLDKDGTRSTVTVDAATLPIDHQLTTALSQVCALMPLKLIITSYYYR